MVWAASGGVDSVVDDALHGSRPASRAARKLVGQSPWLMASAAPNGRACQRGVQDPVAPAPRDRMRGAAHVGNETDTHFGHRHLRGVGDHPHAWAVDGDPDATTHHDAVHGARHTGLLKRPICALSTYSSYQKLSCLGNRRRDGAVIERYEVAGLRTDRASGPAPSTITRRTLSSCFPVGEHLGTSRLTIGWVKRIDGLRAVEGDQADGRSRQLPRDILVFPPTSMQCRSST